jgi:RNA polymerase sigma factor (sigma-70 family)
MTGRDRENAVAEAFMEERERLVAMAYRMLGSRADAEDAVQEAWLRLARQDAASIDNLSGWLTTVVGRVCIDMLRSRKARPIASPDDGLPEFVVTEDNVSAPEDDALLADSVGLALLVVLDSLGPAERLALVLHDMFAVPFEEVGQIIGKSTDATKMLASRARRKVQCKPRPDGERQQQRAVLDAFLAAARDGDFERLLRVLDPQVKWRTHTAHGVVVKLGATKVAAKARRGAYVKATVHPVLVNGEPGIVAWAANGTPLGVLACTVVDGRIVEITSLRDPRQLAAMNLPGRPD